MAKTRDGQELLAKIRKGSTAAFTAPDYEAALALLPGWKTETVKEGRSVVAFRVTTPDGKVAEVAHRSRMGLNFYNHPTLDGVDMGICYLDRVLAVKTSLLKDIDAVLGPVPKKAPRKGREEAKTCPVCFRDIMLDASGRMVHHGYQRPGYGYIVGDCFAVGYEPWEVSPKGNIDYVARILKPTQKTFAARVKFLKSDKVESLTKEEPDYSAPRDARGNCPMKQTILTPADGYKFTSLLESLTRTAERNLKMVTEDIEVREEQIANWKAA